MENINTKSIQNLKGRIEKAAQSHHETRVAHIIAGFVRSQPAGFEQVIHQYGGWYSRSHMTRALQEGLRITASKLDIEHHDVDQSSYDLADINHFRNALRTINNDIDTAIFQGDPDDLTVHPVRPITCEDFLTFLNDMDDEAV